MHALAGAGEAAGVDDRDEGLQEIEIEHGYTCAIDLSNT